MASSVSVTASLNGDTKGLLNRLNKINAVDRRGVLNAIGESLRTSAVERFQSQTGPDGGRWKPSIRATSDGGKTLIKTSVLRDSIQTQSSSNGVTVGTNDIRAATLQFGDERTIRAKSSKYLTFNIGGEWKRVKEVKVNIPARPFLGISSEDEQEIRETIEEVFNG